MSRKNDGSILVVTVFVFLLVNIIVINCSAIIMSNTKYTKYNYEEIYLKEQCLSKIELIYSNILNEVKIALDESENFESFEAHFISNNSTDFINRINDISKVPINTKKCNISRVNITSEKHLYYKIESKVAYNKFVKNMVVYVKIENPFDNNQFLEQNLDMAEENLYETSEEVFHIEDIEGLDDILKDAKELNQNVDKDESENLEMGETEINLEEDSNSDVVKKNFGENEIVQDYKNDIKPSDLVTVYGCKEV